MSQVVKKVVWYSSNGYESRHIKFLQQLIDEKILLFCAVGKDCELWHDIIDELFVSNGDERDFFMITTWHEDETLGEVVKFAESYQIEGIDKNQVRIIEV